MYAIVETGGKQFKVAEGDTVDVDKLPGSVKDEVVLDRVLLLAGADDAVRVGKPLLEGVKVRARILAQDRDRKIVVLKYKAKKNYRRKSGHRQAFTRLAIEKIEA